MKTIDITTTQKVTIEYELAGLRDRFVAMLIDVMIIGAIWVVLSLLLISALQNEMDEWSAARLAGMAVTFTFIGYHFVSEFLMGGQTLGKKAVGIKVVKLNGQEMMATDYLLRALFHFVDIIMSFGILGSLLITSTERSQRFGDLAANTGVIKVKFNMRFRLEDILKISTLDKYEPQYPDVRQFTEDDMLLIKSVIARHREFGNSAHQDVVDQLTRDMMLKLDVTQTPKDKINFLKTLIKDYIVLTR
ncbi:MAG: RDD family protein [Saprospiraceae bacterium]